MPFNHNWEPPAFNPDFRPGIGEAVGKEYRKWCKQHPEATNHQRKKAHLSISDNLRPDYPTVKELGVWIGQNNNHLR